jgi:RimJ/RimL family protein N-acetyltransferase
VRTIETARLLLEPQLAAHADEMYAVLADPAIYEFENAPPASPEALRERYRKLETRRSPDGREQWLNWVVRMRETDRAIGYVQATVMAGGDTLIAYEFGSAWWGRGLASEAVAAAIGRLRASHGARAVGAVFKRPNARSRRLLERLGLRPALAGEFPHTAAADDEDAMVLARPEL